MEPLLSLALSLAVGLLVGTERGWHEREAPEGGRVAGIRTFGLIGFLGGLWALIASALGELLLGFAFVALAVVLLAARLRDMQAPRDLGITTIVAGMVTFALGALAVQGETAIAAAGAVLTMTLLSLKPVLHRWLRGLQEPDLLAAIQLLLISVVILPVLPDRGMGPWQALNPHEIWLLVVLIAAISFAGYIAIKLLGARRGVLLTGLLGGLVSSTATTLDLARLARDRGLAAVASAGIMLASAVMLPRMGVLVAVVNPALLPALIAPLGLMLAVLTVAAWWFARGADRGASPTAETLANPLKLRVAVSFGVFLAVVMLGAKALHEWLGSNGLYVAAAISGLADVDAITLSLGRLARQGADGLVIERAIVLAAIVNNMIKGVMAAGIAGRAVLARVVPAMLLAAIAGAISVL